MMFGMWMEMIGKGKYDIGISYVAVRVPHGYVSGHINQARIRGFDRGCDYVNIYIIYYDTHTTLFIPLT